MRRPNGDPLEEFPKGSFWDACVDVMFTLTFAQSKSFLRRPPHTNPNFFFEFPDGLCCISVQWRSPLIHRVATAGALPLALAIRCVGFEAGQIGLHVPTVREKKTGPCGPSEVFPPSRSSSLSPGLSPSLSSSCSLTGATSNQRISTHIRLVCKLYTSQAQS